MEDPIKQFYKSRTETNWTKRYESPFVARKYFFRRLWQLLADELANASLVLDSGSGDGVLSVLMAYHHPSQRVIAMDISEQAMHIAREAARAYGVENRMWFVVGDAEYLPFKHAALPAIISSHVLEHLPDFDRGARELLDSLSPGGTALIALPACLNPSSMVHFGMDAFWRIGRRSLFAFWIGLGKVIIAWLKDNEGVQEGYAGVNALPHIRCFPSRAVKRLSGQGFQIIMWHADSLLLPYIGYLLPQFLKIQQWIDDHLTRKKFFRNMGYGVIIKAQKF